MRKFTITIGPRGTVRTALEAEAPDSVTALSEHLHLVFPGERIDVAPALTEEERRAADLAYLLNQEARERRRISECTRWERAMDPRREWR